jgi:Ca2+-binding RTX toxin-like protein
MRRLRITGWVVATAALAAAAAPAAVAAGAECSVSNGTLAIGVPGYVPGGLGHPDTTEIVGLSVDGSGAFVVTDNGTPVACPGSPSTTNVTSVAFSALSSGLHEVHLSEPNSFQHPQGGSIPVDINLSGGQNTVQLLGGSGPHDWVGGQQTGGGGDAFDLDAAVGNGPELTLEGIAIVKLSTGSGGDHLSGAGSSDPYSNEAGQLGAPMTATLDVTSGSPSKPESDDRLVGGAASDTLWAGGGNDSIAGGAGKDDLVGWDGKDTLSGGEGQDDLTGDSGADTIIGGTGIDTIDYLDLGRRDGVHVSLDGKRNDGGKIDGVHNGRGGDLIAADVENVDGSPHDDVLVGNGAPNLLFGSLGDDRIFGRGGNDRLQGLDGKDRLFGGPGRDVLNGGAGRDLLDGGAGHDRLHGSHQDTCLRTRARQPHC